jgi:hypothetical protein
MLAKSGAAYGQQQALAEQQKLKQQYDIAKLQSERIKDLSAAAGRVGTWQATKLDDGSVLRWNTGTGEEKVIPATQIKEWYKLKSEGFKLAGERGMTGDAASAWADAYADDTLAKAPKPTNPRPGTLAPASPSAVTTGTQGEVAPAPAAGQTPVITEPPKYDAKLTPDQRAWAERDRFESLRKQIAAESKANNRQGVEELQRIMTAEFPNGAPAAPAAARPTKPLPTTMTEGEAARVKKVKEGLGTGDVKTYEQSNALIESTDKTITSLQRMLANAQPGKTFSGPLANVMSQVGGLVAYFDPKDQLSKRAAGSEEYYADLQNVVREKLKAYGSGTAISNVDLATAEKSLASLSQTEEGKKLILQAMLEDLTRIQEIEKGRKEYFLKENKFDGYSYPTVPVSAKVGDKTVTMIQYANAYMKKNPSASFGDARAAWARAVAGTK